MEEIKRLKHSLDVVNEAVCPHLRREPEFQEIKDLLNRYIPIKAKLDEDDMYCPACEAWITSVIGISKIKLYCSHCGQLVSYNEEEE